MRILPWCAALVLICGVTAAAEDVKPSPEKTLCDKRYTFSGRKKEIGTYTIKAVEKDSKIVIVESIDLPTEGMKIFMKATVTYSAATLTPTIASAETSIDGKPAMKGTVTFSGKTFDELSNMHLNLRTKEVLDPPTSVVKKEQPIAAGTVVFQSALPAIGPRLLPKEGELKDVVFVEFPDDIDELSHLKSGYRIVREKADDKGEFDMKVYSPQEKAVAHARFGKDGQLVTYFAYGNLVFTEAEKK